MDHKKQLELIDTIFTPQFIVENVAEIWIDISENETIGKARVEDLARSLTSCGKISRRSSPSTV